MFGSTKAMRIFLLWLQIIVGLNIFAQVNLVMNGQLSVCIDTNVSGVAKFNNQVKYVEIEGWEHNTCQQLYAPNFSANNGSFLTLNLHTAVGEDDFRVTNISGKLCKPLLAGHKYLVKFYVKPFDVSHFYSGISVQFLDSIPPSQQYFSYDNFKKKCESISSACYLYDGYVSDTLNFTQISFTYSAKGGEKVIYIYNSQPLCGRSLKLSKPYNLFDDKKQATYRYSKWCVYVVSNLSVIPITNPNESCDGQVNIYSDTIIDTSTSVKNSFVLRYDSGSDIPNELSMLNTLCTVLSEKRFSKVKVVSHTDGTGDEKYNKELSDKRANYVASTIGKCTDTPIVIESVADKIRVENKVQSFINRRVEVFLE
jgi:hypothetical protein